MIYCVWYPSGGFGHFINSILNSYGKNFARPASKIEFSDDGNSHNVAYTGPSYSHHQPIYFFNSNPLLNYSIVVDNGINDESTQFLSHFADSTIIKICYSNFSWPVVARTMIDKAMRSNIESQLPTTDWGTDESWARREKYFLFLRDHKLRHAWKPDKHCDYRLYIEEIYQDYEGFHSILNYYVGLEHCEDIWLEWRRANARYIDPVKIAKNIIVDVTEKWHTDLTHITDMWTQAVVYYYIWLSFGIEVPHNDFANFFTDTSQIMELVS